MELQLNKQPVTINETILNSTVEQAAEFDIVLPDYCPDVVRILKCSGTPVVTDVYVTGDKLIIEGVIVANVYYKSPEKELCKTEAKQTFQKTIDLKTAPDNPVVSVQPQMSYLNCRAVNQRRIEMRGAVALPIQVTAAREEQVVTSASGMGVQSRPVWVEVGKIVAGQKRNFSVREDVELGMGKPAATSVIRAAAIPTLTDQKAVAGKLVLKGEVAVDVLYRTQDEANRLETATFTLPMSTILDVPGVTEDTSCSVTLKMGTLDVTPKTGLDGEAVALAVDGTVIADVVAAEAGSYPVAVDCYGTKYETHADNKMLSFYKILDPVKEKIVIKEMMDYPQGCKDVTDLWVELNSYGSKIENNQLLCTGKITLEMFAKDEQNEIELFEQTLDFEHKMPITPGCDAATAQINFALAGMHYSLQGGQIDFRCEILCTGVVVCEHKREVITNVSVDATKPARENMASSLNVYFANKGESIWNIAKRYSTSPDLIMQENGITEDTLPEKCMLLIPVL